MNNKLTPSRRFLSLNLSDSDCEFSESTGMVIYRIT